MDAAEADFDAKLYKASGDLIPELEAKLPLLIWHDGKKRKRLRTHVPYGKCMELAFILDRFQEWPQLLDPLLASLIGAIVDGFTTFITTCPEAYNNQLEATAGRDLPVPLPNALSSLLYAFCKVRGYKVIVRLLNNEPRYVEPMLSCLRSWDTSKPAETGSSMVWQMKYIMLLWLSHLMLAPFELSTLSTSNDLEANQKLESISVDLPDVAKDVLLLAFQSLSSPSKERESAVILLVRLALRRDMQTLNLASRLVEYSTHCLTVNNDRTVTVYYNLGHLALLYSIVNLGTNSEVAPFLAKVYQVASRLATSDGEQFSSVRDSAPARKLLVKILRVCLVHAIALTDSTTGLDGYTVNSWLEDSIQYFLEWLGDRESPVRMAASKALSVITLKLDVAMAAEIVEAVLGGLSENVLLEHPSTRRLMAKTELPVDQTAHFPRNLSAVDPLRWHGLMLTLGHLLFRKSPPPYQLSDVIEALLLGLEFEQRSNVGTSIGVGVRDAACFGVWALARKYSTNDLEAITFTDVAGVSSEDDTTAHSVLQILATRLVISACLDPSGNIRRGSSAALQELIGRHPDTINQGIPVVQVVDYVAVARRSRAFMEVAVQAGSLDHVYHQALLEALVGWRGAKAADSESRRWASAAMRILLVSTQLPQKVSILLRLRDEIYRLGSRNLGLTAGARHGLLLGTAALIDSVLSASPLHAEEVLSSLESFDFAKLIGNLEARLTADLEVAMEGVCTLMESLAQLKLLVESGIEFESANFANRMLPTIDRCIVACEKPLTVDASSRAIVATFPLLAEPDKNALLERWLDAKQQQKHADMVCKGRLRALANLHVLCHSRNLGLQIVQFLEELIIGNVAIEVKTSAMESLCVLLLSTDSQDDQSLERSCNTIIRGLTDYTNDQRGDIGSLLRLQSLEAVEVLHSAQSDEALRLNISNMLTPYVLRLSAEKLNKVRYRAWVCLKKIWSPRSYGTDFSAASDHLEDVSTERYYRELLKLLTVETLRQPLVVGLCSSIGGSEEVNHACCSAFLSLALEQDRDERVELVHSVVTALLMFLNNVAPGEDHEVLPIVEFLTFLLNQDLVAEGNMQNDEAEVWKVVQKVHSPTSSIERIDVLGRLCSELQSLAILRARALDQLTRQLLHRYPRVRNAAADTLYTSCLVEELLRADWNAPSASNKPVVLEVRRTLKIAKTAAS